MIDIDSYVLGILWAWGRYEPDGGFYFVRAQNRYHLEVLHQYFGCTNTIYPILDKGKDRHCLKIRKALLPLADLEAIGWAARNEDERPYPLVVDDHADFLRAYMEIHATFGWQTSYAIKKTKEGKYYRLRLRIFGNQKLISQINDLLSAELGISHSPQPAHNKKTMYVQMTSMEEIRKLLEYIDGSPRSPEWWAEAGEYLANPRKSP